MRSLIPLLFLLSIAAFGCKDTTKLQSRCVSDEQCVEDNGRPDWVCDRDIGECVCNSDNACSENEHCERRPSGDGRCHPDRSCEWNEDCPPGQFCDTRDRFCRSSGCSVDSQCQLGHICDTVSNSCVKGCRSHGDCLYGDACLCSDGEGGVAPCTCDVLDEDGRRDCQPGVCESDVCGDTSFCEPGQVCKQSVDGVQWQCEDDYRGPYCEGCDATPGSSVCGSASNFCLTDSYTPGAPPHCGVDCSQGQECPAGFTCSDVLRPTQNSCTSHESCKPPPGAPSCEEDADCPPGARCDDGLCAGKCNGWEGSSVAGWCSCLTDEECPTQTCVAGRCDITGALCQDHEDCQGQIVCLNEGEVGYCKIGENCAPAPGLTCSEFREMRRIR